MSIPSTHILVSKTIPQLKKLVLLRDNGDSRTQAGNIQDEPGSFCSIKKQKNAQKN